LGRKVELKTAQEREEEGKRGPGEVTTDVPYGDLVAGTQYTMNEKKGEPDGGFQNSTIQKKEERKVGEGEYS